MNYEHESDGKRHRAWVFVRNNYTDECEHAVFALTVESDCGSCGREVGDSCTPHLQGCVNFATVKTWEQVCELLPGFYVKAKSPFSKFDQWWDYTLKGEQSHEEWEQLHQDGPNFGKNVDATTWGVCPVDNKREGADVRAARNLALCKKRKISEMDPSVVANQLRNYKYGATALRAEEMAHTLKRLPGDRGDHHEWHYGGPSCGKSYYAEEQQSSVPYKHESNDKWWDDYDYEAIVIFDDVDEEQKRNCQRFKAALDQSVFRVQYKGGMLAVRPQKVIVTANVHPGEIWKGVHLEAILDRLGDKIYHWPECRYQFKMVDDKRVFLKGPDGKKLANEFWHPPMNLVITHPTGPTPIVDV